MTTLQLIKSANVWPALKIALIYAVIGALWILLSDKLLAYFTSDMQVLTQIQTYKGWTFILVTAILVFFLVHRKLIEIGNLNAQLQHRVNTLESFLPICANCKKSENQTQIQRKWTLGKIWKAIFLNAHHLCFHMVFVQNVRKSYMAMF